MKGFVNEEVVSRFNFSSSGMDGALRFVQWKDDGIAFIDYVISGFYAKQHGRIDRIKTAFKAFWDLAVFDKEFILYEIVIEDNEKLKEFKRFVSEMREIDEAK